MSAVTAIADKNVITWQGATAVRAGGRGGVHRGAGIPRTLVWAAFALLVLLTAGCGAGFAARGRALLLLATTCAFLCVAGALIAWLGAAANKAREHRYVVGSEDADYVRRPYFGISSHRLVAASCSSEHASIMLTIRPLVGNMRMALAPRTAARHGAHPPCGTCSAMHLSACAARSCSSSDLAPRRRHSRPIDHGLLPTPWLAE